MTGIICAVDTEINPFLINMENAEVIKYASLEFHSGSLNGSSVVIVRSGVCKVNAAVAAQILCERFKNPDCVLFSGTAGGIDSRLRIGDTVVVTESVYHDVASGILKQDLFPSDSGLIKICKEALKKNPPKQAVYFGRAVTGENFIVNEGREKILRKFNPLCVDMETAAVAHVCQMNGVPFLAVRSVSDTEEKSGFKSFYANAEMASQNSFEVVKKILDYKKLLAE